MQLTVLVSDTKTVNCRDPPVAASSGSGCPVRLPRCRRRFGPPGRIHDVHRNVPHQGSMRTSTAQVGRPPDPARGAPSERRFLGPSIPARGTAARSNQPTGPSLTDVSTIVRHPDIALGKNDLTKPDTSLVVTVHGGRDRRRRRVTCVDHDGRRSVGVIRFRPADVHPVHRPSIANRDSAAGCARMAPLNWYARRLGRSRSERQQGHS